jgi:hypothetical protein
MHAQDLTQFLDLAADPWCMSAEAAYVIAPALEANRTLTSLNLSHHQLGDTGCSALAR